MAKTPNTFSVTGSGTHVHIQRGLGSQVLTRDDALNLAAWLVAIADPDGKDFTGVFDTVAEQAERSA